MQHNIFQEMTVMISEWCSSIKTGDKPLYIALADALESDIHSGILKPGEKLPPQRELADRLGVNLSTVTRAFRVCALNGLIFGVVGSGTFVASDVKVPLSLISQNRSPGIIEMGQVLPLHCMDANTAQIAKALLQDMDMEKLIRYSEPAGNLAHRTIGAEWLKRFNINASAVRIFLSGPDTI